MRWKQTLLHLAGAWRRWDAEQVRVGAAQFTRVDCRLRCTDPTGAAVNPQGLDPYLQPWVLPFSSPLSASLPLSAPLPVSWIALILTFIQYPVRSLSPLSSLTSLNVSSPRLWQSFQPPVLAAHGCVRSLTTFFFSPPSPLLSPRRTFRYSLSCHTLYCSYFFALRLCLHWIVRAASWCRKILHSKRQIKLGPNATDVSLRGLSGGRRHVFFISIDYLDRHLKGDSHLANRTQSSTWRGCDQDGVMN